MQSTLGEGDRKGDDFCANLEDRDKETEVFGGAPQTLRNGADFPIGPSTPCVLQIWWLSPFSPPPCESYSLEH